MAQCLSTLAAYPETPGLVSSSYTVFYNCTLGPEDSMPFSKP